MEWGEVMGYVATALGAGGLTQIINWRISKRKGIAEVKSDEIDNMRKAMEDFYKPLLNHQDERIAAQNTRIAELENEVKTIREEKRQMELSYQKQITDLQTQITEITKALGIKVSKQIRNEKKLSKTKKEA